ncbi:MAG: YybH family protein [Gemmatimonadota bacterium]
MKYRPTFPLLLGLVVASCAGETGETTDETMEMAAPVADAAGLEALTATFAERYNARDVGALADMYADDALTLPADGSVNEGKEAITAALERAMAMSPTLSLETGDVMVFDNGAVARGAYGVEVTPEGTEPISFSGHYMTTFIPEGDAWKVAFVITNYDAPPPEGLPAGEAPGEPPEEAGEMTDLITAYAEHFNQGHASMVADLYTDDAVAAFANLPLAEGRAAIESTLAERMAEGSPQLTIHDVGTMDLGPGWKLDGGWYELTATTDEGSATQIGSYMILCQQGDDGSWKIRWAVSNGKPS